jgi:glycosyltransferase involved in cell wall biosynthesis
METGLFLRQQVPLDKKRITFNYLEEVDDMWIHLFYELHKKLGLKHSEIWMWGGGPRRVDYKEGFVEKWFPEFPANNYKPDFIFSRGGFKEYIPVIQANPNAFKIYYGAIYKDRFNPKANGDDTDYDLIMADSRIQYDAIKRSGYKPFKLLKPCAENIFKELHSDKTYDIVFIANAKQKKIKGHKWFFETMKQRNYKILQIGNLDADIVKWCDGLNIDFRGWVPRKEIPEIACKAKVGVCCSTGDSCPRIIPEMQAMGIPVVIRNSPGLHLWEDFVRYDSCCVMNDREGFLRAIDLFVENHKNIDARSFYEENLSLDKISDELISKIKISSQTASGLATRCV